MRKKRKKSKGFKLSSLTILVIMTIMVVIVLGIQIHKTNEENKAHEAKKQELYYKIQEENIRKEGIDALGESIMSKSFIEKTAREKFNLCYPGEIIFKPVDEK